MKKLFWIRTGLLLTVLVFAVLGGNFLYTGAESASPLEQAVEAVPITEGTPLTQAFSPTYARVTCISLALQPSGQAAVMPETAGNLTVTLSRHDTGEELFQSTVSLGGAPDHWYLDFPVDCRLEPGAQYDFSLLLEDSQARNTPSLYCLPLSGQIPEITAGLSDGSAGLSASAAMRLNYDVLVPARLAVFAASLAVILLCAAASALHSLRPNPGRGRAEKSGTGKGAAGKNGAGKGLPGKNGTGKNLAEKSGIGKGTAGKSGTGKSPAEKSGIGKGSAGKSGTGKSPAEKNGIGKSPAERDWPEIDTAENDMAEAAMAGGGRAEPDKTGRNKSGRDKSGRSGEEKAGNEITLNKFLAVKIRGLSLIHILFFAAVTAAAVIVRLAFLPVKSNDYYIAYETWIHEIRGSGILSSLGKDIGDNPPLYMTLVTLACYLPFEPVVIVKIPSLLFDFILAVACVKLSRQLGVTGPHRKLTLYAVILLNPLTLLDSAAWGQCDSLYSTFVLLTLLAICAAKPWSAKPPIGRRHSFWKSGDGICLLFAIAFSLKLQAVFFLPVICLLWIMQKRNVLKPLQLLWIPIVYTISCLPMYLAGRSLKVMFKVYLGQANRNYGTLTLNYPNLYHLMGTWSESLYDSYFVYGMLLAFLLLILLFYQLYCRKVEMNSLTLCKVTALSILTVCFCLPLVHERYAYVAEMLLFVIMLKEGKHIKTALITMLCTLFTYCSYLMQLEQGFSVLPEPVIALIRLGVIFFLAGDIFQQKQDAARQAAK